jgi:hypothetical protein
MSASHEWVWPGQRRFMTRLHLLCLSALTLFTAGCGNSREKAECKHYLEFIGRAAEEFKREHGKACWETPVVGKAGLSWRVELLPYLEQENTYRALKKETGGFTTPLFTPDATPTAEAKMLLGSSVFAYTLSNPPGTAPFRRVFSAERPEAFVVVESSDYVPWGKPGDDLVIEEGKPLPKMGGNFKGGFLALCAGGKVRWIPSASSEAATLAALFDGGDP